MKIYTKTGDAGETSLLGGQRVSKDHARIQAVGAIDELNAALGVARAELKRGEGTVLSVDALLNSVQNELFDLGAELASPEPTPAAQYLAVEQVQALEQAIDRWQGELPPLTFFILPGGCAAAAQLHWARCVCRRAERLLLTIARETAIRAEVLTYINRLSDLLFVAARLVNQQAGRSDIRWQKLEER